MEESKVNTSDFIKNYSINPKLKKTQSVYSDIGTSKKEGINYSKNINDIKSLIKKSNSKCKTKINKIKNDILILKKQISEIEIPYCKYTQKDKEQNLIKQKLISNTINLYQEEFDSNKENILLLEEEYNNCSLQLYNLISLKDNYEERIIFIIF